MSDSYFVSLLKGRFFQVHQDATCFFEGCLWFVVPITHPLQDWGPIVYNAECLWIDHFFTPFSQTQALHGPFLLLTIFVTLFLEPLFKPQYIYTCVKNMKNKGFFSDYPSFFDQAWKIRELKVMFLDVLSKKPTTM